MPAIQMRRKSGGRALLLAAVAVCICTYQSTHEISPANAAVAEGGFVMGHPRLVAAGVALLGLLMCAAEPDDVPAPIGGPLENRGDYPSVLFINTLLSFCSGMMNALAFLECNATIAHHSGNLTHWGRNWGDNDALRFFFYLLAFWGGGFMVGSFKSDTESIFSARFSATMMASVIYAVGGAVICLVTGDKLATLVLWALSQGIQNGLCRKFSSMPLCSTHFTGYLTDAGNFIGAWLRAKLYGETLPPMQKTYLFLSCMFSFAFGGFAAKLGRDSYGMVVAFVPAIIMASVACGIYPLPDPKDKKR